MHTRVLLVVLVMCLNLPSQQARSEAPQYTKDGQLVRPDNYREWIYLSSGLGMTYGVVEASANPAPLRFDNVFVTPQAYKAFLQTGVWPDKTMFVLEIYGSTSRGSINKHGSYQTDFAGLDVEVKDESRFPDKWAYFNFSETAKSAPASTPGKNDCWKCHEQNAAVEHSFVQFYPELLKIARTKGTIKPGVRLDD